MRPALPPLVDWIGVAADRAEGPPPDPGDWTAFERVAEAHGLAGLFFRRFGDALPPVTRERWRRRFLFQHAANAAVAAQAAEVLEALTQAGCRAALLKGAWAMDRLYPERGCRALDDLDLLVDEARLDAVHAVLLRLGYQAPPAAAPEYVLATLRAGEARPYARREGYGLDVHTALAGPYAPGGNDEVWARRDPGSAAPCVEHFLIHTALHLTRDHDLGRVSLKGFVDLLLCVLLLESGAGWEPVWETAVRWRCGAPVARVAATLRERWGVSVPGLPPQAKGFDPRPLVLGDERRAAARLTRSYARRLRLAVLLPPGPARARYFFRLLFPLSAGPPARRLAHLALRLTRGLAAKGSGGPSRALRGQRNNGSDSAEPSRAPGAGVPAQRVAALAPQE